MKKIILLCFIIFFPFTSVSKTLFFGDSLTGTMGVVYKGKINRDTDIEYVVGSGLENKKINWIKKIKNKNLNKYNKVIISIGTNDYFISDKEKYENKVLNLISVIKKSNIKEIIWILPPPVENENINKGIENVRNIITQSSIKDNFKIIDPRKVIGDKYTLYLNKEQIRTKDGIHYTMKGAEIIIKCLMK